MGGSSISMGGSRIGSKKIAVGRKLHPRHEIAV